MRFEDLFRAQLDYVWRIARLQVGDAAADDVTQEAFLVARRRWSSFDGGSVRGWLYRITTNVARNHVRSRRRRERVMAAVPSPAQEAGLEEQLGWSQAARRLDEELRALTAVKREAFLLHVVEGIPAGEVAEALGVPTRTVYSRVRAARAELRARLAGQQERRGARG
jgi:RNA polymerase sigma-70 factor (ECF subfamily)